MSDQNLSRLISWTASSKRYLGIRSRTWLTLPLNCPLTLIMFLDLNPTVVFDRWHHLYRVWDLASCSSPQCPELSGHLAAISKDKYIAAPIRTPRELGHLGAVLLLHPWDQRLPVNPFLLAIWFCNLLATLLSKFRSSEWWALEFSLIIRNGGNTWLKCLTWLSSKARASNWCWLNGAKVSLDADMVNELVACIPVTLLHHLSSVVYRDALVFISLELMWPGLKTPSESQQKGSGTEIPIQTHPLLGAISSYDGLGPIHFKRSGRTGLLVFRATSFLHGRTSRVIC